MKSLRTFVCGLAIACAALCLPSRSAAQDVSNLYTGGVAWNSTGTPAVAGTATYAHLVNTAGTYSFTKMDVVPSSLKPFTVVTNIGTGVAQKVWTFAGIPVFCSTDAGVAWAGQSVGWGYSAGCTVPYKLKPYKDGALYIMPSARFNKASVGGAGYQPIIGVEFGFGR